jgi:hypothetical protein
LKTDTHAEAFSDLSKEVRIKALLQEFSEGSTKMRGIMIAIAVGVPISMLLELPRTTSAILAGCICLIIYTVYDNHLCRRRLGRLMQILAE